MLYRLKFSRARQENHNPKILLLHHHHYLHHHLHHHHNHRLRHYSDISLATTSQEASQKSTLSSCSLIWLTTSWRWSSPGTSTTPMRTCPSRTSVATSSTPPPSPRRGRRRWSSWWRGSSRANPTASHSRVSRLSTTCSLAALTWSGRCSSWIPRNREFFCLFLFFIFIFFLTGSDERWVWQGGELGGGHPGGIEIHKYTNI